MAIPALASLIGRALPAMFAAGEGGVLSGLVSRGASFVGRGAAGVAADGGATSGMGSLLADLVKQGLSGSGKSKGPAEKAESDEEERKRYRRRMPSAADLFDFKPPTANPSSSSGQAGPGQSGQSPKGVFNPIVSGKASMSAPASQRPSTMIVPNANEEGTGAAQNKAEIDRRRQEEKATESLKKFTDGIFKATGGFGKTVSAMLKINLATYAGAKALEMFVGTVSESRRDLGRWNGSIAASFAQLDIRRMQGDIKTAEGVSGSTAGLNAAYGDLLEELRPIRQDMMTLINGVGIVAANVGRVLAFVSKYLPFVQLIHLAAQKIEENTGKAKAGRDPMRDILDMLTNAPRPGPRPAPAPIEPKAPLPPIV